MGTSGQETAIWENNALANMSQWVNSRSTALHVRHAEFLVMMMLEIFDTIALSSIL